MLEPAPPKLIVGIGFIVLGAIALIVLQLQDRYILFWLYAIPVTFLAIGIVVLSLGHWSRIWPAVLNRNGIWLSFPVALMFLPLFFGWTPPDKATNNAFLAIWFVLFLLVLPWSVAAALLGFGAVLSHTGQDDWVMRVLFYVACLIAVVGAHINASFASWAMKKLGRRPPS